MYDKLHVITYNFAAADLSVEGTKRIPLPKGAQMARVLDIAAEVTTDTTGSAATVAVGYAGDPYAYAALSVPVATAGEVVNGRTEGGVFRGVYQADAGAGDLDYLTVTIDGAATAGAANLTIAVGFDHIDA